MICVTLHLAYPHLERILFIIPLILLVYFPRYKVAITKQKDSEHSCGSLYNQNGIWDPAVDFSKYIEDNESIVNEVRVGLSCSFKT